MAQPAFNGQITVTSIEQLDTNLFKVSADFVDYQGVWSGNAVAVGDLIFLDVSGWNPGNVGKYQIASVVSKNGLGFTVEVFFAEPGDVIEPNHYMANNIGAVLRPTPHHSLVPIVLQHTQLIPENIAVQPSNEDLYTTIDDFSSGGGSGVTTYTYTQASPSSTWNVTHNGGSTNFICQVYDTSGKLILPDSVEIVDSNNVTITFASDQTGKAQVLVFG